MPLYEYRCRACGAELELLVSRDETPACTECRSADLDRQLSGFSVGASSPGEHSCGCGGPDDCIGNRAAAARARGTATCC